MLVTIAVWTALLAHDGNAAGPARIEALEWMAGCWAFSSGGREVHEQWMTPAGGVMLGMSRALRAGKAQSLEFVVLRAGDQGIAYEAHPLGQAPATFQLVELGERGAIFENPAHDYPQRIIYRREGDRLLARIEGPQNGQTKGSDYPFQRVACPQ
jgi:hypothetical protein